MVHRDILVNGKPCAYSEIRIIISEQVANVRYFSLEVPVPPALLFTKTLQKTYIAKTIHLPGTAILSHLFKQRDLEISQLKRGYRTLTRK
jgi:hypothetical protein